MELMSTQPTFFYLETKSNIELSCHDIWNGSFYEFATVAERNAEPWLQVELLILIAMTKFLFTLTLLCGGAGVEVVATQKVMSSNPFSFCSKPTW